MTISVIQINLNRPRKSLDNFYSYLVRNPNTLGLVQEAYKYKGIIPRHKDSNIFGDQAGRAAIIAPKHFPILVVSQLCSPDYTVVQMVMENKSQFFCSIYLDIKLNVIGTELVNICNFFKNNNSNAVLGLDSNSWSPLWGSRESNPRGMELEVFIIQNDLFVHNKGSAPTFQTSRASSTIDLTISYGDSNLIKGWHTMNEYFFSDHKALKFQVTVGNIPHPTVQVVNWSNFKEALVINDRFYEIWTLDIIEDEAMLIQQVVEMHFTKVRMNKK